MRGLHQLSISSVIARKTRGAGAESVISCSIDIVRMLSSAVGLMLFGSFRCVGETEEGGCEMVADRIDVVLVDPAERDGVEVVPALAPIAANDDESGVFEDAQVLHHREARKREGGTEIPRRAGAVFEEVEDSAAGRVGERLPDGVEPGLGHM